MPHHQLTLTCRTAALEVRSSHELHLGCTASSCHSAVPPSLRNADRKSSHMAKILCTAMESEAQPLSEASGASKIGSQSMPRHKLDGFISHPAMADASIHLAAVPIGPDSQPMRVPIGMGCTWAAPGLPPAVCWSIASIMPNASTVPGMPNSQGASQSSLTNNIQMLPSEPYGTKALSGMPPQAAFAIAALSTKQMAGAQQGMLSHKAGAPESTVKDITFRIQWQAHAPQHTPHILDESHRSFKHKHLMPVWQHGHLALVSHSCCSSSRSSFDRYQYSPLGAQNPCQAGAREWQPPAAAAACALQMQAVQTCIAHDRSGLDGKIRLQAPACASIQQSACGRPTGDVWQAIAASAMALIRVAAVESGSMQRWQANFFDPTAPSARPGASLPYTPGYPAVSEGYGDAFGGMSHAGTALQPRLLPVGGQLDQAASQAASPAATSWRHVSMGEGALARVIISGGMGALGALVAIWITLIQGSSRPLLLGRSGRFAPDSAAPLVQV